MKSEVLVQRVFLSLTFIFILFIMYASWTPGYGGFGGERIGFRWPHSFSDIFRNHNLRDISTNVLLYLPLGFFLALSLAKQRLHFFSPWLLAGFVVSLTIECGQMFISRTPDVVDLLTNSTGFVLGYWVIYGGVHLYGLDAGVIMGLSRKDELNTRIQSIAGLRFIYVCLFMLVALLPFDISVSLTRVYAQLLVNEQGALRIILDPTYHLSRWNETGINLTLNLLSLMPMGILSAYLAGFRDRFSLSGAILPCVVLVVLSEMAQLFIMSRTTDIAMLFLAVMAGVIAWALVRTMIKLQSTEKVSTQANPQEIWKSLLVALIGYAVMIALFAWSPFSFELNPVIVANKILYESNFVPFRAHFDVRSMGSALDIVKETGIFVPFGILIALLLSKVIPKAPRARVLLLASIGAMIFASFTELSQAVIVGRYIDVTDILLGGLGGLCGAAALGLFHTADF